MSIVKGSSIWNDGTLKSIFVGDQLAIKENDLIGTFSGGAIDYATPHSLKVIPLDRSIVFTDRRGREILRVSEDHLLYWKEFDNTRMGMAKELHGYINKTKNHRFEFFSLTDDLSLGSVSIGKAKIVEEKVQSLSIKTVLETLLVRYGGSKKDGFEDILVGDR